MAEPSLRSFLNTINKEFGDNTAIILDDTETVNIPVIPTGIKIIDEATGIGGFPIGRISEVFGKEGTGKTSLCFHAIAQAHKQGLDAAFIDAENAVSYQRMKELGVDTNRLIFSQPNSGEEALNLVEMMTRSNKFSIIVVDSVAALIPQAEIDKDMGDSVMGVHARLMSQAMRKLASPINKHKVALVFTNQTRSKIGFMGGETTTGGHALKFYSSLRLKMQYIGKITNPQGQRISGKYRMTVVKNKLSVPFKEAEFEINEYGIDDSIYVVKELLDKGIVQKAGSWFSYKGESIAQGKIALSRLLRKDNELKTRLLKELGNI